MSEYYAPVDPDALKREREARRRVGAKRLTMDHVVPLGRGGRSRRGNVVAACKDCNTRKQSLVPVEWEAYLRTLGTVSVD